MARNKNFWCGTGRLGADPEIRTTQNGTKVANMRVCCSRDWKDKDGNEKKSSFWAPVVVWGATVEVVDRYCRKGDLIRVEGPLANREWTDRDGNKRHSIEVVISGFQGEIELLASANRDRQQPTQSNSTQRYQSGNSMSDAAGYGYGSSSQPLDDEIPF